MKVDGNTNFSITAEGTEQGGLRGQGNYAIAISGLAMHLNTDVQLLKDDANIVVGLGGIVHVKFLHVKANFPDDYEGSDDTIALIANFGAGDVIMQGKTFAFVDTDITSIKLTNNSDDATGATATVFIDMAGDA